MATEKVPEKATSPVEVIQAEKRGLYYANADTVFDPSLVLLTFQGKGLFFGPQSHFLVADTSVNLVADIVYNLELQYDLNGLDDVKDPAKTPVKDFVNDPLKDSVKDPMKTPEKTSVKTLVKDSTIKEPWKKLRQYKLKSQFIPWNQESTNSAFESLSSNQTLQRFIKNENGQNLSIPLLKYELSRADSVLLDKDNSQQLGRKSFETFIFTFFVTGS